MEDYLAATIGKCLDNLEAAGFLLPVSFSCIDVHGAMFNGKLRGSWDAVETDLLWGTVQELELPCHFLYVDAQGKGAVLVLGQESYFLNIPELLQSQTETLH